MKATQIDTSNTAEHVENKVHFFVSGAHGQRSDSTQLMDLFECTGVCRFACFSCEHAAHSINSDDALDFMLQVMDTTSQHFMQKSEQWSCTIDNSDVSPQIIHSTDADVLNLFSGACQAMKNSASTAQADILCV
jgi:hypothetical protein